MEQEAVFEISRRRDSEEVSRAAGKPSALAIDSEVLTEIEMPLAIAETAWPVTDLEKRKETPQSTVADLAPLGRACGAGRIGWPRPADSALDCRAVCRRTPFLSVAVTQALDFYDHRTRTDLTATNHSNYHARNDDYSTSSSPCFLIDDAGSTARRCDANCRSVNVVDGDRLDAAYANL